MKKLKNAVRRRLREGGAPASFDSRAADPVVPAHPVAPAALSSPYFLGLERAAAPAGFRLELSPEDSSSGARSTEVIFYLRGRSPEHVVEGGAYFRGGDFSEPSEVLYDHYFPYAGRVAMPFGAGNAYGATRLSLVQYMGYLAKIMQNGAW